MESYGIGISRASATHRGKRVETASTPIANAIFTKASSNSSNVSPSSALHISSKLLSITSFPAISTGNPAGDAIISISNSK